MPQLMPFFFVNQVVFTMYINYHNIFLLNILPKFVRVFISVFILIIIRK